MPLVSVAAGQPIRSTHISQFTRWVTGATKDQSASFTTTSVSEYTATLTNEDTSAGLMLKGVYGGTTAFTFNKTGATFNIPIISTSTLLASLFSSAGQLLVGTGGTGVAALNVGSTFQALTVNSAATGLTYVASLQSLLASAGSMIGASGANTPVHIPKGSALQSLVMNAGATGQTWVTCAYALATTQGQIFYASTSGALAALAPGTNGQFLTLTTGVPAWSNGSNARNVVTSASGATSAPTTSSTSYTDLNDMSCTLTTSGGDLMAWFSGVFFNTTAGAAVQVGLSLDGAAEVAARYIAPSGANEQGTVSIAHRFSGVSSTSHTVKARWLVSSGLGNAVTTLRELVVMET